jgi:hypothetical protein
MPPLYHLPSLQLCEEKANSFAKFAVCKHHFVAEKQAGRGVALAGVNSHTNPPVQYLGILYVEEQLPLHYNVCQNKKKKLLIFFHVERAENA